MVVIKKFNTPERGTAKFRDMVEKENRNYDKYKAGKLNPDGTRNAEISFTDPTKKSKFGSTLMAIECLNGCGKTFDVTSATKVIICSFCKCFHTLEYNYEADELTVETPYKKNE